MKTLMGGIMVENSVTNTQTHKGKKRSACTCCALPK